MGIIKTHSLLSNKRGNADKGPEALLDASYNLEFYDLETETEVYKKGISTLSPVLTSDSPEHMSEDVEQRMDGIYDDGKFPVLIGGEHSVSIGAFRSASKHYPGLSILQLDAHSDMRDEYEGSSHNHACVMARAREVCQSITQVGIRSSAIEEKKNIDQERIFYAHNSQKRIPGEPLTPPGPLISLKRQSSS